MNTAVKRFMQVGIFEGISFLLLLGVAMPLKYAAGLPIAVMIVGSLHGLFFVLYLITLGYAALTNKWPFTRVMGALVASVLPFGPFVFDAYLKKNVA
ncbi:hypothetical protein A374_07704 [Fictibacillus macauensis ZFHKF-1]|uniref:DUF3817 domain-containing protein n=1 Tax=Fictibacillus macauensis ZFHKF-1 TaxID=1196324 RepID=I8AIW4_9BACL|nr:DUF3817 domain-containing protein [Fictibacillus macauensis]EIT85702.1 hypothetical protein A374_07704 [Fictibacillus macauensis ZFHKF-1]